MKRVRQTEVTELNEVAVVLNRCTNFHQLWRQSRSWLTYYRTVMLKKTLWPKPRWRPWNSKNGSYFRTVSQILIKFGGNADTVTFYQTVMLENELWQKTIWRWLQCWILRKCSHFWTIAPIFTQFGSKVGLINVRSAITSWNYLTDSAVYKPTLVNSLTFCESYKLRSQVLLKLRGMTSIYLLLCMFHSPISRAVQPC